MLTPKKSLGQHFLKNPKILNKITSALEISKNNVIIEIGPGTGNLTEFLIKKAKKVIAVEKDKSLVKYLKEKFNNFKNLEIKEGDVLKINPKNLNVKNNYKIVGNIPYYITSRLLKTIFEKWPKPKMIVLTIQKEVAQRIIAKPPHTNLLAVSVQYFSTPKIISYVSKNNFYPRPKVDSAIIKLIPAKQKITSSKNFFKILKAGFSQKRKLLISNLSKKLNIPKKSLLEVFKKLNINLKARSENLSLKEWKNLSKSLSK